MTRKDLEKEMLDLSKEERVHLVQKLVLSLDMPSVKELKNDWLLEAQHRARELDDGSIQPVSGEEVAKKARALIQ